MASALSLKPLGLTFSFLGFIQGLIWFIMSILGILIYAEVIFDHPKYFLDKPTLLLIIVYIRGFEKILILLIVYCILSLCWTVVSCYQLILLDTIRNKTKPDKEVFQRKKLKKLQSVLYEWIGLTITTCVVDLVLVGIVAMDYSDLNEINKIAGTVLPFDLLDLTGLKIILAVAARGVVIWIINVAGIIICFRLVKQVKQEEVLQLRSNNNIQGIEAFDHLKAGPWPDHCEVTHDVNPVPISHVNPSFIEDENQNQSVNIRQMDYGPNTICNYIDEEFRYIDQEYDGRSRDFLNGDNDQIYNNQNPNANNYRNRNSNHENRRAEEKKKPIKILDMELIPDEELEPPTVPPPDYTPPNTPLVRARSVLKSNPIYNN